MVEYFTNHVVKAGTIRFNGSFEIKRFARIHHRHPMIANSAINYDYIPRLDSQPFADLPIRCFNASYPRGIDKNFITFALVHHFGVSGHDEHTCFFCFCCK